MPPVVRFAPSPTGHLHIGNARTALLNWLFARQQGGQFILRFDDTDVARCRQEYVDSIQEDLAWLGIFPDKTVHQSQRSTLYDAAVSTLAERRRLYRCYETEDELAYRRKRQMARGLPPLYDRSGLKLSEADHAEKASEGKQPHWRFLLDPCRVDWKDGVLGPQHVEASSLSDPVLVRGDGSYLYTLTSVVDDLDLGVTHVIRGADHITNTGVQIEIIAALGGVPPQFAHHNLLTLPSGEGLSKRMGHLSLRSLREQGMEPLAVAALAVLIGSSHAVEPVASLDQLGQMIGLEDMSASAAKFDPAELEALTARTLHLLGYEEVASRLEGLGVAGGEAFWLAIRGNLHRLEEAQMWWHIAISDIPSVGREETYLREAARLLPPEPWNASTWSTWTGLLKQQTGRKGKDLFMPLRLALTGTESGPEMSAFLPFIGRVRGLKRLGG